MFSSLFQSISNSLGFGQMNDPDDMGLTRRKFAGVGYEENDDDDLTTTIRRFQKDKGLTVDGIMNPLGETETALNDSLSKQLERLNPLREAEEDMSAYRTPGIVPSNKPQPNQSIFKSLPSLILKDEVGNNKTNDHEDMTGIQEQLAGLGYLPERNATKPDLYITKPIEDAIRRFQTDNNLKNDGWAGPNGETQRTLNRRVGEAISGVKKPAKAKSFEEFITSKEQISYPPTVNKEQDRIDIILKDKPAIFDLNNNPKATDEKPWYENGKRAKAVVLGNDAIIVEMAKKHNVDPDMVRAVMWSENARGHWGILGDVADKVGISKTKFPMNIDPKIWGTLADGKTQKDLTDPRDNIEASTILIKRLRDRVKNPSMDKIGALWHSTAREYTDDYSEYMERIYREKPWLTR